MFGLFFNGLEHKTVDKTKSHLVNWIHDLLRLVSSKLGTSCQYGGGVTRSHPCLTGSFWGGPDPRVGHHLWVVVVHVSLVSTGSPSPVDPRVEVTSLRVTDSLPSSTFGRRSPDGPGTHSSLPEHISRPVLLKPVVTCGSTTEIGYGTSPTVHVDRDSRPVRVVTWSTYLLH